MGTTTTNKKNSSGLGSAILLTPHEHAWELSFEDNAEVLTFNDYEAGLKRASDLAREAKTALYVNGEDGALVGVWEFYANQTRPEAVHVMPAGEVWAIRTHEDRVVDHFDTKEKATREGRKLAKTEGFDLVVHYGTGRVQKITSFGADA